MRESSFTVNFQLVLSIFIGGGFISNVCAFGTTTSLQQTRKYGLRIMSDSALLFSKESPGEEEEQLLLQPFQVYPVISQLAGINWTGSCRYVGGDLVPLSKLKLSGGVRYDISGTTITLSSFLSFPDGKTREVMMTGGRDHSSGSDNPSQVITLRSVKEGGPIRMHLTEVGTDTLLINEVEEVSGKTILTASLSIIQGPEGMELVQVSHEVGEGKQSIEGHQIWRLTGGPVEVHDFA